MAYSNFTIEQLEQDLGINIVVSSQSMFSKVAIEPSDWLRHSLHLAEKSPTFSEKARSEMIVTPILLEIVEINNHELTVFSGETLNADIEKGLNGECDYLFSRKPQSYHVAAPIFALVEAKKNDVDVGVPQCIAQMYGAAIFNKKRSNEISVIYGCVTTGEEWLFLKLAGVNAVIDNQKYFIRETPLILGAIQQIIDNTPKFTPAL